MEVEWTWSPRYGYVSESYFSSLAKGGTKTCRAGLEALVQAHLRAAEAISDILATNGPEFAEAAARAEIAKAHPQGMHETCSCSHRQAIRRRDALVKVADCRAERPGWRRMFGFAIR